MGHIKGNIAYTAEELVEFIKTNGHRDGDCVLWAGYLTQEGRPRIMWHHKFYSVQRLLLRLTTDSFNPRHFAQTTCGNRTCVNPKHLIMCKQSDITRQAWKDKPRPSVLIALSKAKNARFGIDKAREAQAMRAAGMSCRQVGQHYGVTPSCVCTCMNNWRRMGVI